MWPARSQRLTIFSPWDFSRMMYRACPQVRVVGTLQHLFTLDVSTVTFKTLESTPE